MVIGPKSGTYALILSSASYARIQIGYLGRMQVERGYYFHLGSESGPYGLRAQIAHHQRLSTRARCRIGYLRAHTRLRSAGYPSRRYTLFDQSAMC
jgi:Uri superfamily endonuclease